MFKFFTLSVFLFMSAVMVHADSQTVQVFVLAGQSNMQGHGKVEKGRSPDPNTKGEVDGGIGSLRWYAKKNKDVAAWLNADGTWKKRDDVWCWSATGKEDVGPLTTGFGKGPWIGPEFGFGQVVGDAVDAPVVIIKACWGGKTLAEDFRPPSAGKSPHGGSDEAVGHYYREMIKIVKDITSDLGKYFPELKGKSHEIVGFGWHQGWNDAGSEAMVKEYESNFVHLIDDLQKEFENSSLKVVVANTGMIGRNAKSGIRTELCDIQLGLKSKVKNCETVETRDFKRETEESPSHFGYHWNHNGESHYLVGHAMGEAMVKLLK